MAFQWPENYAATMQPPGEAPSRALWFVFRRGALLVSAPPQAPSLPCCRSAQDLGILAQRTQYLGVLDGEHCFAADVAGDAQAPGGWNWQGLRSLFGALNDAHVALAGRALQLLDWDRSHQFCGACATPTVAKTEERARECPGCGLVAYPRLAPVVMCLVRRDGSELLLARSPRFPKGMYSALAGFVEPGETLEQCLAREVFEEVGVSVKNLRYFASQPWPFPHSLMIAFHAEHDSGELQIDGREIEEAQWFSVDALPQLPATISIARKLIDAAKGEMLKA